MLASFHGPISVSFPTYARINPASKDPAEKPTATRSPQYYLDGQRVICFPENGAL
jgi:hypothetical protein